jgi:hypothetical protein
LVNVIDRKFLRKELKKSQKLIITHKSNIEKGKSWRYTLGRTFGRFLG